MPVNDAEHSRWLSMRKLEKNIAQVKELMYDCLYFAIYNLTKEGKISFESCHRILTKYLNVCWIATKFMPGLLTDLHLLVGFIMLQQIMDLLRMLDALCNRI